MIIEINNTLSEEEKQWVIISSYINTQEVKNEIIRILENSNIDKIKPIINEGKNRFQIDELLTKYIRSTFNKDIPELEKREKIKTIIKSILSLDSKDIVIENKWKIHIIQKWHKLEKND